MYNITATGRVARDPEVKMLENDRSLTTFAVVSDRYDPKAENNRTGDFLDVEIWGKRGVAFAEFFKKGDGAILCGTLKIEKWVDKESGQNRYKPVITATEWEFPVARKGGDEKESGEKAPF